MESFLSHDYRCVCGRLLFKGLLLKSYTEIKCDRCGQIVEIMGLLTGEYKNRLIMLNDENGIVSNVSPSLKTLLGFSPEDIIGQSVLQLYHDDSSKEKSRILSNRVHNFKYLGFDGLLRTKDSQNVFAVTRLKTIVKDQKKYLLRIIDIVGSEPPERLPNFDQGNYGHFVAELDLNANVLYVQDVVETYFGFKPEEIIGHPIARFFAADEKAWRESNNKHLFASGKSYRVSNFRTLHKDGHLVEYEISATPTIDETGEVVGYKVVSWIKTP